MLQDWKDIVPMATDKQVIEIIDPIVAMLQGHRGKRNQIYSNEIIRELNDMGLLGRVKEPKTYVTKAIGVIRRYHIEICVASTSKGYYIADTPEEYETWLQTCHTKFENTASLLQAAEDDMREMWPDYESKYIDNED